MVWQSQAPHAGFSDGAPWLPVKDPQAARNVAALEADEDSVLHHYRTVLAWRKSQAAMLRGRTEFIDLPEPLLAFHRATTAETMTCVYNLSAKDQSVTVKGAAQPSGPSHAVLDGDILRLPPNGWAYLISQGTPPTVSRT
jgi:alpha-glucosidase